MRINVYSQELITEPYSGLPHVELVNQRADTGIYYHAVRMFLHSPKELHHTIEDDDRSAISFWLPRTVERRDYLAESFEEMAALIRSAPEETGLD